MYKLRVISGKHKGKYVAKRGLSIIFGRKYVKCLDKSETYDTLEAATTTTWHLRWGVMVVAERYGHCWGNDDYAYSSHLARKMFDYSNNDLVEDIQETIRRGALETIYRCTQNLPKFGKKCPTNWLHRALVANNRLKS